MPARTERYRFVLPFEIEDVNGVPQTLLSGYADVTRGGGMKFERVVFLGPGGKSRTERHLKKGHVKKLEQFAITARVDPQPQTRPLLAAEPSCTLLNFRHMTKIRRA